MLDALEHSMSALDASVHAQRQLVADASHELRTPVTSLRTNIEILAAGAGHGARRTPAPARRRGRADRGADAADERPDRTRARRGAARRHRGRAPGPARRRGRRADPPRTRPRPRSLLELAPTLIAGVPARLERAVGEPDRQRGQVQPARRAGRDRAARRGADRARPRPRDLRGGPAARLRPLLPRRRGARAPRLGPRPGDRAPGRPPARRDASPPSAHRAAGR